MEIFAGNSHPELASLICRRLGVDPSPIKIGLGGGDEGENESTCQETRVEIGISVRGKSVYLLQTGSRDVNNSVMELLIMSYACKTSCAARIIAVIPYLPYAKQSKMRKRSSIPAKLVASLLGKAGVQHVITVDLHTKEIQGFFDMPVDNLRASPFIIQYIQEEIPDYRNAVIVARKPDATKRATSFAERLRLNIAVVHSDDRTESEIDMEDGRYSPPPGAEQEQRVPRKRDKSVSVDESRIKLVGDVHGKIAIIVDDTIDEVDSLIRLANVLHHRGAYRVYVMATHGIFSDQGRDQLQASVIDEVVVTNTIPVDDKRQADSKIKTIDISPLLSEAMRRIHNGESMSYLFRDVPVGD